MTEDVKQMYDDMLSMIDGLDGISYKIAKDWIKSYCENETVLRAEREKLSREGTIVERPNGDKENPRVALIKKYEQMEIKYGKELKTVVEKAGVASVDRLAAYVGR